MECCDSKKIPTEKAICPGCGSAAQVVKVRTLKHWLKPSLAFNILDLPFYFCKTRDCHVVYFSEDCNVQYTKEQLRYRIGLKEKSSPIVVCYCFGITEEMISREARETSKSSFSTWIAGEVNQGNCACDVRNPSGCCCLKDIKSLEALYKKVP
jgi:hypothetical protein